MMLRVQGDLRAEVERHSTSCSHLQDSSQLMQLKITELEEARSAMKQGVFYSRVKLRCACDSRYAYSLCVVVMP
jgi:hypothetical protein